MPVCRVVIWRRSGKDYHVYHGKIGNHCRSEGTRPSGGVDINKLLDKEQSSSETVDTESVTKEALLTIRSLDSTVGHKALVFRKWYASFCHPSPERYNQGEANEQL